MSYLQKWESINILYLKRVHVDLFVGPSPSQASAENNNSHKKKKTLILQQPCDTHLIYLASMEPAQEVCNSLILFT